MSKDRGRLTDVPYRNWLPKNNVKQHNARVDAFFKIILGAIVVGAALIMVWSYTDKKNEVRNAKIFKNQVLAYLPVNAAVNFPKPEGL